MISGFEIWNVNEDGTFDKDPSTQEPINSTLYFGGELNLWCLLEAFRYCQY
jgi:hypothetical protein